MKYSAVRLALAAMLAAAALTPTPTLATAVSTPDGSGGFFVAWSETRNESDLLQTSEVLAQHFTAAGVPAPGWPARGLAVADVPPDADSPSIVSDGAGGVIVVWMDYSGGRTMPRAQHLSAAGQHLWASAGVALSAGDSVRVAPVAVSDGAGGAIVAWLDLSDGTFTQGGIVLQHVLGIGAVDGAWPGAGLLVVGGNVISSGVQLFGDGSGGAIAVWLQGTYHAQRVTSAGVRLWSPAAGKDLGLNYPTQVAGDGVGGLVTAHDDLSPTLDHEIIGFRFDETGAPAWGPDGIVVRSSAASITGSTVAPDSTGGAIIAWIDESTGGSFAQRVTLDGDLRAGWPVDGAPLFASGGPGILNADGTGGVFALSSLLLGPHDNEILAQHLVGSDGSRASGWPSAGAEMIASGADPFGPEGRTLVADGTGGTIATWLDRRSGILGQDVYAQRLDASGARQWTDDGLTIATEAFEQRQPALVADGLGGAIAFWKDKRSGGWDLYARHLGAGGTPLGASTPIGAAANDQSNPQAVSDGAGGAVAAWRDWRNGVMGVDAQRLTAVGATPWTANGVELAEGLGGFIPSAIAADGAGGAIVAWVQNFYPNGVYAQRLDATGAPAWGDPVNLTFVSSFADWIDAIPDGSGGAIVLWYGLGLDADSSLFVYGLHAQRLNAAGARQWPGVDGVAVARALSSEIPARIAGDGAGGVFVAWQDGDPLDGSAVIRVQHRDATGARAAGWPADGVTIASLVERKEVAAAIPDGAGGVVVGWGELRGGDIRALAQRVDASGAVSWTAQGVALSNRGGDQIPHGLVSDGAGGAIGVWMDSGSNTWDVYAQRLNGAGARQWGAGGAPICTAIGNQYAPAIAADGSGGAIFAWQDGRALVAAQGPTLAGSPGASDQIFMARVDAAGAPLWTSDGVVPALASLVSATAADGVARLEWFLAAGTSVAVERSEDGASWSVRANVVADGEGRVRFTDADVSPARRYGWRLAITTPSGPVNAGEVWLDTPSGPTFALRGARPNPAGAASIVSFSLPAAAPARLEILDVAGRRVWSREVGSLGAGSHAVATPDLRPGVYVIRLVQGPRHATARFARVR